MNKILIGFFTLTMMSLPAFAENFPRGMANQDVKACENEALEQETWNTTKSYLKVVCLYKKLIRVNRLRIRKMMDLRAVCEKKNQENYLGQVKLQTKWLVDRHQLFSSQLAEFKENPLSQMNILNRKEIMVIIANDLTITYSAMMYFDKLQQELEELE